MLKVLLWFVSNDVRFFQRAMTILDRQHNGLDIVGVTAGVPVQLQVNGKIVPFVSLSEVDGGGDYDLLLVVGAKEIGMSNITKIARQVRLPEEKLLGDWIVCIPGFTLKKYRQLQRAHLSILATNCFGGYISHTFGLPFYSPFVNLYLEHPDFIRFLRAPRVYMEEQLIFKEMQLQTKPMKADKEHPVFTLGNVDLHFNHYDKTDENKFNERRKKINWYNLFAMICTESKDILEQFDALPYGKKACFVPFKSDLDSAWYINPSIRKDLKVFDSVVLRFAEGLPFYYDPFDMLLYGKKTPLIEM